MDAIKEFDSSIQDVIFVLDGDTVNKSKFSSTIAVKDVIKTTTGPRKTIFEDIKNSMKLKIQIMILQDLP